MPSSPPLLIDLAGVARLADVRRPVASVWRSRFASAADPFPPVASQKGGRALFDAMSVAQWLARTEHGNNPDAIADAAASATPAGFDVAEPSHIAAVDALLALRAASGQPVGDVALDELRRRAIAADPDDSCLATEVSSASAAWAEWADLLADAAYSPVQASLLLERRHAATTSSAGSSGPLTSEAEELLVALTAALTADRQTELAVAAGITPSLVADIISRLGDDVELAVPSMPETRSIRRRLLCDGVVLPQTSSLGTSPRTSIVRLPSNNARATSEILNALDEIVLELRDHDRAIVIAPASALVDPVTWSDGLVRAGVLRSGRVRAIVKLPAGLVTAAPREALALWVLGGEWGDVPVADRLTAVADLTDTALTVAARADLASDVLAAMGSNRDWHAHAFRFTQLVRTTSLLVSRASLVSKRRPPSGTSQSDRDLPALLDQALQELGDDAPPHTPSPALGHPVASAQVEQLIKARHLRLLPGTRVTPEELSESGLVVVGAADLDNPARIGDRYVAPLDFATHHPSARLTAAGDVVFRTAPTAKAWVDPDGSKVVTYPARILRIDTADPGGLLPDLVAADINRSAGGPAAWRRWQLRRVSPRATAPLRSSLSDLATRREVLLRRVQALDAYAELLSAGVVSGAVSLTDNAADAASDSN